MRKFNMFITAVCFLTLIKLRSSKNKSIYATLLVTRTNYSSTANDIGKIYTNEAREGIVSVFLFHSGKFEAT